MQLRRVVISGLGVVTPLGSDLRTFWSNLVSGKSGIRRISLFDASLFTTRIAGEVPDVELVLRSLTPAMVQRTNRGTLFALVAAESAWNDSGLERATVDPGRLGVAVGSAVGAARTLEQNHSLLMDGGPAAMPAWMISTTLLSATSAEIAVRFGAEGPTFGITSACASGSHSIGEAFRLIRTGEADIMLAGGADAAICPMSLAGFGAMRALSTRNGTPAQASRPFDRQRDGFVLGEGAGVLVLEEYAHARRRGAYPYCELAGYGCTADCYHLTHPHPEGIATARGMKLALNQAEVEASQIDYINAHGTATPQGDLSETLAIKAVAGAHAKRSILVSSTKSMTGHLLGGAGGVEAVVCVLAMQESRVPPTINLDDPDPSCDLDYVPHQARDRKVNVALSNSAGFGGHNVTLCFKRVE